LNDSIDLIDLSDLNDLNERTKQMTDRELKHLACELSALTVFRGVLESAPMAALLAYLNEVGDVREKLYRYGAFVRALGDYNCSLSDFLSHAVEVDENSYVVSVARGAVLPPSLADNAAHELSVFSRLTHLTPADLCGTLDYDGYLPRFENGAIDFETTYRERLAHIDRYGYGVFATAGMFRVSGEEILPVDSADEITLDRFVGYEEERKKVLDNTEALVEGRPAANVLLFGDAGTGKSSTVKACANHFRDRGVRLIELRKDQLFSLSYVMGRIADNPLKFIIFIDDLSFQKNDDCFSMLKAVLEGSASAKAKNAVIYATSNRRHIVKENFSDRANEDDLHHSDTVQELMSLSDRFGLTVYFSKPGKPLYLDIVHRLAEQKGIPMEAGELNLKAEAFALAKGSRSPRVAEQFINSLI
jgi:hypothetical protein